MAMQVVELDVKDREATVSRLVVHESALITMINVRLKLEAPLAALQSRGIAHDGWRGENWAVARFEMEPADCLGQEARFGAIARIVMEVSKAMRSIGLRRTFIKTFDHEHGKCRYQFRMGASPFSVGREKKSLITSNGS